MAIAKLFSMFQTDSCVDDVDIIMRTIIKTRSESPGSSPGYQPCDHHYSNMLPPTLHHNVSGDTTEDDDNDDDLDKEPGHDPCPGDVTHVTTLRNCLLITINIDFLSNISLSPPVSLVRIIDFLVVDPTRSTLIRDLQQ